MSDKVPTIIESAKQNKGTRTVLETVLEPGATVWPHYHTLFDETFDVLSGGIDIWKGEEKISLQPGDSATVERNTVHKYLVGDQMTTVRITFSPGSLNFEKAMKILRGMQDDGNYAQLSTADSNNKVLMAAISGLTDSNAIGNEKLMLDNLHQSEGDNVIRIREYLLKKYAESY